MTTKQTNTATTNIWLEETKGSDILKRPKVGEEVDVQFTPYFKAYGQHWLNKKSYVCPGTGCPLCTSGNAEASKVTRKWFGPVFDRKTNTVKLFDFGLEIKKQLGDLSKNEKWGDPSTLEVTISCTNDGRVSYTVTPYKKTTLSAQDKANLETFMARVDLTKFNAPLTVEELREVVGAPPVKEVSSTFIRAKNGQSVEIDFDK